MLSPDDPTVVSVGFAGAQVFHRIRNRWRLGRVADLLKFKLESAGLYLVVVGQLACVDAAAADV